MGKYLRAFTRECGGFFKEPANSYRYSFFDIAAVSAKADLLYQRKRHVLSQIT